MAIRSMFSVGIVIAGCVVSPVFAGDPGGGPGNRFGGSSKDLIRFQDQVVVPGDSGNIHTFGTAVVACDFNADGVDDLAIGVPGEMFEGAAAAGQVSVLYGNAGMPVGQVFAQQFRQGWFLPGAANVNARFGKALTAGDFDGDGLCDLAVGVPGDSVGGVIGGSVQVLYGNEGISALGIAGNQLWNFDSAGVTGVPQSGDEYGAALAAGDLNGDGIDDLAIGIPGRLVSGNDGAGMVHVLYGGAAGLQTTSPSDDFIDQTAFALTADPDDHFGAALAIGRFAPAVGIGLAIGVPGESIPPFDLAGLVHVVGADANGLDLSHKLTIGANSSTFPGSLASGDQLGWALAAGDFDGDGADELAIGVPGRNRDGVADVGEVLIAWGWDGFFGGFNGDGVGALTDVSGGMLGTALAARDTDGDGRAELAAGAPLRAVGGNLEAGIVEVFRYEDGVWGRIATAHQNLNSPATGVAFTNAWLGASVTFGDFDGNGGAALVTGNPGAHIFDNPAAGSVVVFAEREVFADGFETGSAERWSASVP